MPAGKCSICGTYTKLSFEHIPPRSAFNNLPVKVLPFRPTSPDQSDWLRARTQQRGAGGHTLCIKCNNETGGWYGGSFVEWACQAMQFLRRLSKKSSLLYPYDIYPLRVIKQIVTMFMSVGSGTLAASNPDLVNFVKQKDRKHLPPTYQFFAFFIKSEYLRYGGPALRLDLGSGQQVLFSEFSFPPFGFVMTYNSAVPDERLVNITHFTRYDYDEARRIYLQLPLLSAASPYPGTFSSPA